MAEDNRQLRVALDLVELYLAALERIARADSGVWGQIAHEAIRAGAERSKVRHG